MKEDPLKKLQLQPLRIVSGWSVLFNSFYNLDPLDHSPVHGPFTLIFHEDIIGSAMKFPRNLLK